MTLSHLTILAEVKGPLKLDREGLDFFFFDTMQNSGIIFIIRKNEPYKYSKDGMWR